MYSLTDSWTDACVESSGALGLRTAVLPVLFCWSAVFGYFLLILINFLDIGHISDYAKLFCGTDLTLECFGILFESWIE